MTEPSSYVISANQEVLGYILRERIGAGGYGEVWSVEAPGGMMKAAKFIYGFHDDNRAKRELKAIDRIKHIRHPFLLSLERIDIVDGRMVVITELADMCLKARFTACQAQGLDAIPREELHQYLREAAEALDYIAEHHSLAHLDIKPENLLIVGNHVKVADFGLVKDLHTVNQSLMNGLTPAYAAPELFDGRPQRTSDQYSLAIVYQELLTGTRPFSGTTAAQLANQHLHSWPNLNSLPRGDQAVIARALSKVPDKRFPTCRDLMEELGKRRNRIRRRVSDMPSAPPIDSDTSVVCNFGPTAEAGHDDQTGSMSDTFIPVMTCEGQIDSLEPMTIDESTSCVRPTLFVGVGRTGIQVLRQLKRRMVNRYGSPDRIPSFRFLGIDIDRKSLMETDSGTEASSLRTSEMITIPLRRPEEYRTDSRLDLAWIGRRWIYNVPKSQLTESLRPLGRLAFIDHHDTIYRRVMDDLGHLIREEHLATTAETMELLPSTNPPQIIVVASTSGGTGSGMILDLAYSLRIAMSELGLAKDSVYGILTHGSSRQGSDPRLAVANSCAFLKELNHYNLNGYPGSRGCRIPEFTNDTPVFDGVYFLHLGDDMQDVEYNAWISRIARYLFLSTATRCNGFFESSRKPDEQDMQALRTLGIGCLGQISSMLSERGANALANRLFHKWLVLAENAETNDSVSQLVRRLLVVSELDDSLLTPKITEIINEAMGGRAKRKIAEIVESHLSRSAGNSKSTLPTIERVLDELLAGNRKTDAASIGGYQTFVVEFVEAKIPVVTKKCGDDLRNHILALVDEPDFRIGGANKVAAEVLVHLQQASIASEARHNLIGQQIVSCQEKFPFTGQDKNTTDLDEEERIERLTAELIDLRIEAFICDTQRNMYKRIAKEVAAIQVTLEQFTALFDPFWIRPTRKPAEVPQLEPEAPGISLSELYDQNVQPGGANSLSDLEAFLENQTRALEGGLLAIVKEGASRIRRLSVDIQEAANILVNRELQLLDIDSVINNTGSQVERLSDWFDGVARDATPTLANCGGTRRLLIAIPQRAPIPFIASILEKKLEQSANVIPSTCGELIVCTEMDNVPIEHVTARILSTQPDCAELIERIPSRTDVDWSSVIPHC